MHIFYHDDFDGVASAAILAGSVRERLGIECTSESTNYHVKPRWLDPTPLKTTPYAIVDFMYHPAATMWFDHHDTTFLTPEYHAKFQRDKSPLHGWDPKRPSCGAFVYDQLTADWAAGAERYAELARYADLIDSVQHDSPEAFYDMSDPGNALNHAHRYMSEGQKASLVQALTSGKMASGVSAVQPAIDRACELVPKAVLTVADLVRKSGEVAVTSTLGVNIPLMRFVPFMVYPTALYSITMYDGGDGPVRISVSKNPWLDFNHQQLGHLMRTFGGGGHGYAAACEFGTGEASISQGWQCVNTLTRQLNS